MAELGDLNFDLHKLRVVSYAVLLSYHSCSTHESIISTKLRIQHIKVAARSPELLQLNQVLCDVDAIPFPLIKIPYQTKFKLNKKIVEFYVLHVRPK